MIKKTEPHLHPIDRDHSSLWFRPIRQLLNEGKPACPTLQLYFSVLPEKRLHFGTLCYTKNRRLIFWPAVSTTISMENDPSKQIITDHVTLELVNEKTHVTSYNADGSRSHHHRNWRLSEFPQTGLKLWFFLAIRRSVVREQLNAVERTVPIPGRDKERRENEKKRRLSEFRNYAEMMAHAPVTLPSLDSGGNFYYLAVYLRAGGRQVKQFDESCFPLGSLPKGMITGWDDAERVMIQTSIVHLGSISLLLATALPPGDLSEERFGFPTSCIGAKNQIEQEINGNVNTLKRIS